MTEFNAMKQRLSNLAIVFHSLRHLRLSMIYWRVHRTLKGGVLRLIGKAGLSRTLFGRALPTVTVTPVPVLTGRYHCEDIDLETLRFSFLNDVETLPGDAEAMRAAVARKPLLWQFHFGYHDFLLAILDSRRDARTADAVLAFVDAWATAFPLHAQGSRSSAWHPYVLSIRIEAWVRLDAMLAACGVRADDARLRILREGVERMTRVLLRNLEKGTMANHLLRNIKGLVFAGLYLDTSAGAQARRIGMRLLDRELAEQILDDGCHFERSPMYHVSMTNDVLDMAEAMLLCGASVPELLAGTVARMTAFLDRMRHPDGEIPFFNDSTSSFFLRTQEVLERGRSLSIELQEAGSMKQEDEATLGPARSGERQAVDTTDPNRFSGLLVAETGRAWLVMDAGLVGPDYQPGHAHCDTLSFELSVDGRRMITDTGVYHYRESPERTYARSTAAHNTIEVDGAEQSEVWKSFRVGRRAKVLGLARETRDGITLLRGAHDGYERLRRGLLHERAMLLSSDWLLVVDWLHGAGSHRWRSFMHFHPDADVMNDSGAVRARRGETTLQVRCHGDGTLRRHESEYYPAFGEKRTRASIAFEGAGTLPRMFVTEITIGHTRPMFETMENQVRIAGYGAVASVLPKR